MMEHCLSETSVKVPESFKPTTSNLLEQILSPSSAPMCDQLFLRTGNSRSRSENYSNVNSSSECISVKVSESCMSSITEMGNGPIFATQDGIQPRCDKYISKDSTSKQGPGRSYINRLSVMILAFLVIITCITSAVACAFLKQLIDRCNDLESKVNNAQSTFTEELHDAQEICLPCVELVQGPFEEDNLPLKNLTRKTVDGIVLCCGRTPSQFSIILDLVSFILWYKDVRNMMKTSSHMYIMSSLSCYTAYIGQKQKEKCAHEILNLTSTSCANITAGRPIGTPISAHLVAGLQEDSSIGQSYQPLRNWRQDNEATHISGMELLNDRLYVTESGLYFIYSHVGFEVHYNSNEDIVNEKQTLYHYISRYNPIYPNGGSQTIVKGAATQCWEKLKDFGHYTSYASAIVKLNKGDQLYIIVSQLYISKDPKLTYFGAYNIY